MAGLPCTVAVVQLSRKRQAGVDNTIESSFQFAKGTLAEGMVHEKPSGGARRGASGQRCRATASDIRRLKPLVEPHPATLRNDKVLYGMQKVRGSNPLSSTAFFERLSSSQVTNQGK